MWENRVQSLGWEDPLEMEMATPYSLAWRIPSMLPCLVLLELSLRYHRAD